MCRSVAGERVQVWGGVLLCIALTVGCLLAWTAHADPSERTAPQGYDLGRSATSADLKAWDIDVSPSGEGLPPGRGTVQEGKKLYLQKCSMCHGQTGVEGPMNRLVGGQGTLTTQQPIKTVGSYWPYATTLYDYIYRAMPFTAPQSLTPNEVYGLVAWILYQNEIIPKNAVMNRKTVPAVKMPNRDGFIPDPRPDAASH